MSAGYFDAKIAVRLWDKDQELDISELNRRFPAWTYLPILPDRSRTLRDCLREGVKSGLWAAVYGDKKLIETADGFDTLPDIFDGATFLVRDDLWRMIREELDPTASAPVSPPGPGPVPAGGEPPAPEPGPVIDVAKRYARVRLRLPDLPVAKTSNLQPYLWKVLQGIDDSTRLTLTVDVECPAGVPEGVMTKQIVEGLDMLNIGVEWEPSG